MWDGQLKLADSRVESVESLPFILIPTDNPIPHCCGVYYFEVFINSKSRYGSLSIGFYSSEYSTPKYLGLENCICYNSNNGQITWDEDLLPTVRPFFGEGDVIGCGINFLKNLIFFTKNGVLIGPETFTKKLATRVYPLVCLCSPTSQVTGNFGQSSFRFEISRYIAQQRYSALREAIDTKLTAKLTHLTMKRLVMEYLLRHGYLKTAQALSLLREVGHQPPTPANTVERPQQVLADDDSPMSSCSEAISDASRGPTASTTPCEDEHPVNTFQWPETPESIKRRKGLICAIEHGFYLQAMRQLYAEYPKLVQEVPDIIFSLRCRHFIEILFRSQAFVHSMRACTAPSVSTVLGFSHRPTHKRLQPSDVPTDAPVATLRRKCALDTEPAELSLSHDSFHCHKPALVSSAARPLQSCPSRIQNGDFSPKRVEPHSLHKAASIPCIALDAPSPPNGSTADQLEDVPFSLIDAIEYGRFLREVACELKTTGAITAAQLSLLQDAFCLMAYQNPLESPFADLIHPRHREALASAVKNAIMVHLGQPRYALLETAIRLLDSAVLGSRSLQPPASVSTPSSLDVPPLFTAFATVNCPNHHFLPHRGFGADWLEELNTALHRGCPHETPNPNSEPVSPNPALIDCQLAAFFHPALFLG